MIQIYDKTNTDFSKNGNMPLLPTSCLLEAELNGAWVLTLEHPIDALGRWESIVEDAVIQCDTFMPKPQRFRIYEKHKSDGGIIAYARPIFLDTKDILLLDVRPTDKSGQDALNIILSGTGFSGESDIADKATTYLVRKSIPDALLGKNDNSFVNRWGGEAIYDNETVIINKRAGGDYGVSCEFGKNLREIEETVNLDDVITRIVPVSYNGYMLEGDSPWVDSPNIGKYATVHTREVQFKDIALAEDRDGGYADLSALRTALAQAAANKFSVDKVDEPGISYVVDMVNLAETVEYKNYKILETVSLGDTVTCKHKKLNIDVSARVVRIVYDCIRKRNDEVELGNYQNDYFSRLQDLSGRIQQAITPSGIVRADAIQGIINAMNVQLRAQKSIAQTQEVRAMLFEDLDPDSPTYGAMSIGTMGLQISSERTTDGRDWNWTTAMTAKGAIADIFIAGLLTDKTGRNYWNLDTGELRLTSSDLRIDDQTFEEHLKKATNLTVLLSNEYQSIPTDSAGNYTTFPECSTAIQVLYGQTDITSQCTLTATTSAGVTGSLSGTAYKVTALTADTGWVDIKATYLGTLTAVKRFTISKVKDGAQGSNIRILNTEISMTQEEIDTNSAKGYSRNWTVITSTDGLKAGDSVMIQLYNDTKGGEAYILATINEVLSEYRINATSAGLLDKGEVGTSGRVYILEPSVTTIKRGQDKVPLPDEITFSAYYRDGDLATRTAYAGRFIVERSTDGNSWETVYTSAANESSCRYELYTAIEDGNGNYLEDGNGNVIVAWYDEDTVMMRCTLYAAGGTASALDMQTVPVVIDVAALTHMQILDLFTNGGQMEGIFVENGRVYVEASAIRVDDLCALNATIGGWVITKQAIYKEVMDAEGNKYTVYFQPPLKDYPDKTWILSCQKNSVGKFVLYSNGMAQFGSTIITPDGMIYAIKNGHIVQMKPAEDENTDVFSTGDYDEETNGYTNTAYIQANGIFHTRKVIADRAPTYPHIVGDGTYLQMSPVDGSAWGFVVESIGTGQHLRPATSGTMTLGREAFKWGQIWSTAGAISTSDKREKNNITLLDGDRWMKFLLGLRVVSYRLNDGTSGRYHHGLIANEVEELMEHLGIDSSEFAGFVKWQRTEQEEEEEIVTDEKGKKRKRKRFKDIPICDKDGNPEYGYGLRYEEFLPMTIKAVQGLYQENQKLKEELKAMKKDIKELKQMIMKEVG